MLLYSYFKYCSYICVLFVKKLICNVFLAQYFSLALVFKWRVMDYEV